MGQIDPMSKCECGPIEPPRNQTPRMQSFMERYLDPQKVDQHRVAIQIMRHTLMHTGALRYLYEKNTATAYTWGIHFGDTFRPSSGTTRSVTKSCPNNPTYLLPSLGRPPK